ncbi:MAG TPA: hypothetical protein ENI49_07335 [Thermoplasmatales archaeon]|nr:hypothetical protein [Thermoplasmatales archaeon]
MAILGSAIVFTIFTVSVVPYNFIALIIVSIVLTILGICLILFSTMTVTCDREYLRIRTGFITIRKSFSVKDIVSCKVIKIPWYYSWGIRIVPSGWLYRISGSYAIEINMRDGKRYLIGTDEPEKLVEFVNNQLRMVRE